MIKMYYQMLAKGKTKFIKVMGVYKELPHEWNVPYKSSIKHVIGKDEEDCLNRIRPQIKLKYERFYRIKK